MSLPKMETDVKNIEKLAKRPNATDSLDYKKLQKAFDKAGVDIQSFLNNTLIPAIDSGIGGVDIDALQEAQGADKEMAFPVYDPRVGVNAKLSIADILPYTVTVTKAADGTMTCDKTFAHVRAAYNAGQPVLCVYTNEKEQWDTVILTLAECSGSAAIFTRYTEVYQGDTRLVWITLSARGAVDATTTIDASSVAYSNTTDEESKLAVGVRAFLDLLYRKLTGLGKRLPALSAPDAGKLLTAREDGTAGWSQKPTYAASEVTATLQGVGIDGIPTDVQSALNILRALVDPLGMDATADYKASGASSVEVWATMADAGNANSYRVREGRYRITDDSGGVSTVEIADNTIARLVKITEHLSDDFVYVEVFLASTPGETLHRTIYFSSEEHLFDIDGSNYFVPYVDARDNGSFLRVVNGKWAAAQLTDVSEVGA